MNGPVCLIVLDGWGIAPPGPGNAVDLAETPVFDGLWDAWPHAQLGASGRAVGLPEGQMGNSEVGHLNLGAGRVVRQDLVRIDEEIESGAFFENEVLGAACRQARGHALHLMGLVSDGGVHSHIAHLQALLEMAGRQGVERVHVHAFTDGRDVSPTSGAGFLEQVPNLATVVGRYYGMDRDRRWDRTKRAYDALVHGIGQQTDDPVAAVRASYERGVTDEFIEPLVVGDPSQGRIGGRRHGRLLQLQARPHAPDRPCPDRRRLHRLRPRAATAAARPGADDRVLRLTSTLRSPIRPRAWTRCWRRCWPLQASPSCTSPRRRSTPT